MHYKRSTYLKIYLFVFDFKYRYFEKVYIILCPIKFSKVFKICIWIIIPT